MVKLVAASQLVPLEIPYDQRVPVAMARNEQEDPWPGCVHPGVERMERLQVRGASPGHNRARLAPIQPFAVDGEISVGRRHVDDFALTLGCGVGQESRLHRETA